MGSIALARLELDGDLLLVEQVGALEDDAEAALADLLADAVVHADDVGTRTAARHGVDCVVTGGRLEGMWETSSGREGAWLGGCDSSETGPQPYSGNEAWGLCNRRRTRLGVPETGGSKSSRKRLVLQRSSCEETERSEEGTQDRDV